VISRTDGGFIVTAHRLQPYSTVLISFTSNGDISWIKLIKNFHAIDSQRLSDGLILASSSSLLKVNQSGKIVWKRSLEIQAFRSESVGADGNEIVLVGKVEQKRSLYLQVIGLDLKGKVQSSSGYSLSVPNFHISKVIHSAEGTVLSGTTSNSSTGLLMKLNTNQDVDFQTIFGSSKRREAARAVFRTNTGGYVIYASSGPSDVLFLNVNSKGIVPDCNFFHKLTVNKIEVPPVVTKTFGVLAKEFSLPTPRSFSVEAVDSNSSARFTLICSNL